MKKLLLALTCTVALSASAQQAQKVQTNVDRTQTVSLRAAMNNKATAVTDAQAPKKAAADGVYYQIPEGAMWMTVPQPFYTYNSPSLVVAPWTDVFYKNMSVDKTGKWEIITANGAIDMSDNVTEDGDLDYGQYPGGQGGWYSPTYTANGVSYIPFHGTTDPKEMITRVDDLWFHSFVPVNCNMGEDRLYGRGSLAPLSNLYGGGYIDYKDGTTGTCFELVYTASKPMAPLYVQSVDLWADLQDNVSCEAIPEGKELTMYIYNVDELAANKEYAVTAQPNRVTKPVFTLTCTSDDLEWDSDNKEVSYYMAHFTQKIQDETSGELVADPFVIDFPMQIVIAGLEQEGVMINFAGFDMPDEFKFEPDADSNFCWTSQSGDVFDDRNQTWFHCVDENNAVYNHRYEDCNVIIGFTSMFEHVEVVTEATSTKGDELGDVNFMFVSADGQNYMNNVFSNIPGVEVITAIDWFETDDNGVETGNEMYWSDDMYDYDWIMGMAAFPATDADGEELGGQYYIVFECEALPEGETERYAQLHINGLGATSNPLFIIQRDITETTTREELDASVAACKEFFNVVDGVNGINAVTNSGKTYNLMGQQVNGNAKGLVIRDGKKFIVK